MADIKASKSRTATRATPLCDLGTILARRVVFIGPLFRSGFLVIPVAETEISRTDRCRQVDTKKVASAFRADRPGGDTDIDLANLVGLRDGRHTGHSVQGIGSQSVGDWVDNVVSKFQIFNVLRNGYWRMCANLTHDAGIRPAGTNKGLNEISDHNEA